MMTYITNKKYIVVALLIFIMQCCTFDEPFGIWWAIVNVVNESDTTIVIIEKEIARENQTEQKIQPYSKLDYTIGARRDSQEDNLSDNFDYIKVETKEGVLVLELTGEALDENIPYEGKYKSDDIYLLTITQEMVDEALAEAESEESE